MQINLMPDLSLLAVVVIFIAEYFVVTRFFLRPINNVLEARDSEARTAQEIYEHVKRAFTHAEVTLQPDRKRPPARLGPSPLDAPHPGALDAQAPVLVRLSR